MLIWRVDLGEAFSELRQIDPVWTLVGLVLFTVSKFVHTFRWRSLLRRPDLPLRPLFAIFLISNLANALIPFRAGDLVRIELPSRLLGLPRAELASNVVIVETIFDGLAFALLVVAAGFLLGESVGSLPGVIFFVLLVLVAFAGLVVIAHLHAPEDPERSRVLRWMPSQWRHALAPRLHQFLEGMASLRDARGVGFALAVSLVAWLVEVSVYWGMGQAFGIELDLGEAIVLMIAANLIVSLPLTPWDVGPFEVAVTEALVLLGGDRGEASAYAVGIHLLLIVWISITGTIAMLTLNLSPRDVLKRAADGEAVPPGS